MAAARHASSQGFNQTDLPWQQVPERVQVRGKVSVWERGVMTGMFKGQKISSYRKFFEGIAPFFKEISSSGELAEHSVIQKFRITAEDEWRPMIGCKFREYNVLFNNTRS